MSQAPAPTRRPDLPNADSLYETLERVLGQARRLGATAAEASADASRALSVRVRRGDVESVEFQGDRDLAVTLYNSQRKGSASTTDLSEAAIQRCIEQAWSIARLTGEDEWAGLAPAELMANESPDLDLWHPWTLPVDDAIDVARRCEAAALAVDARIENSDGAEVDTREGISAYANSHGFMGHQRASTHAFSTSVIARSNDQMQRDYWYSQARDPADLLEPEAVGRRAGERTVARMGATTPATTRAPVLFPPQLARSLFGHFLGAISGGLLYRDASFLKDRVGETIFSPQVCLAQRPFLLKGAGSAGFDAEGVATVDRDLVDQGVLGGYLLSSYSARRLGLQTTGNAGGVFNLTVSPGDQDLPGLIRQMDRGLLVNELMGQGVSLMTGDYSRGASGFWVENGEIAYPVENITIASSLQAMFKGIVALGNDVDPFSLVRSPSLLIDRMTIAGA